MGKDNFIKFNSTFDTFSVILGTERAEKEIQDVFNCLYHKAEPPKEFPSVFQPKALCNGQSKMFCQNDEFRDFLKKHLWKPWSLPRNSDDWESKDGKYSRIGSLMWLIMHKATINLDQFGSFSEEIFDLADSFILENKSADLKVFLDKIPPFTYMNFWINKVQDYPSCDSYDVFSIRCQISEVYYTLSSFYKVLSRKTQVKYVQTHQDPKELLRQQKVNIFKNLVIKKLTEISNELKDYISDGLHHSFSALGDHFRKMANYDLRKASMDIGYIKTTLKKFEIAVTDAIKKLVPKLSGIIMMSLVQTSANLVEHSTKLAIEVAANANPLKHIFGGTDPRAMMEVSAAVAAAGVKVKEAARLTKAKDEVLEMETILSDGFEKNAKFQNETISLIDNLDKKLKEKKSIGDEELDADINEFLAKYNDYTPNVTLAQIEKYGVLLESMVEEGCRLIKDDIGLASSVNAGFLAGTGNCLTLNSDIAALITTYSQIYDYQFDLMDSLAEAVRSYLAFTSANNLKKKFKKSTVSKYTEQAQLSLTALQMRVSNRIHRLMLVNQLCDIEEYVNGGVEPEGCKTARSELSDSSIDILLSLGEFRCPKSRTDRVQIPTMPQHKNDKAYIDINSLYSGKEAIFQIPDATWLAQYRWINPDYATNHVYFLEDMQLYLPDDVKEERSVRVTVEPAPGEKLFPTETAPKYILTGGRTAHISNEYTEGGQCDVGQKKNNPYDKCKKKSICIKSKAVTPKNPIFASVFSKWVIKSSIWNYGKRGNQKAYPNVKFATNLTLIADIKICKVPCKEKCQTTSKKKPNLEYKIFRRATKCCTTEMKNGYWNAEEHRCKACPLESESSNAGTYCIRKCWKQCKKEDVSSKSGTFYYNGCWQTNRDWNNVKNMTGTFCPIN